MRRLIATFLAAILAVPSEAQVTIAPYEPSMPALAAKLNQNFTALATSVPLSSATCGLIGDGSDESAKLQACFNRVGPNTRLVFGQPASVYNFSTKQAISLPNGGDIDFNNAPMIFTGTEASSSGGVSAIRVTGTGFSISRLNLTCSTKSQEYIGLGLAASTNATLVDNAITGCRWAGLSIYDGSAGTSHDISIIRGNYSLNRYGLTGNAANVYLDHPTVSYDWATTSEGVANSGIWDSLSATASFSGTTMTVSAIGNGSFRAPGTQLSGPGLPDGLTVVSQQAGTGGSTGTYTISAPVTRGSGQVWGSAYYDAILIQNGSNNWTINQPYVTGAGQSGIYTGAISNLTVTGGTVSGNYNKGIDIGPGASFATNINVFGTVLRDNKTGNINFFRVTGGVISNVDVTDTIGAGGILLNSGTTKAVVTGGRACATSLPIFTQDTVVNGQPIAQNNSIIGVDTSCSTGTTQIGFTNNRVSALLTGVGTTLQGPLVGIGGLTSAYPCLKAIGNTFQFRLCDDSGTASFSANGGTFNGTFLMNSTMKSSVGSFSASTTLLGSSTPMQVFTGSSAATATLPAVASSSGQWFFIKNRGSATLTVVDISGGAVIYNTSAASSAAVAAGSSLQLRSDGTYWLIY